MPAQDRHPIHEHTQDPTPRRHSLIHLQGGASTIVHLTPSEVEQLVTQARNRLEARPLLYIETPHLPAKSIVIDAHAVTGIFGVIASEDWKDDRRPSAKRAA